MYIYVYIYICTYIYMYIAPNSRPPPRVPCAPWTQRSRRKLSLHAGFFRGPAQVNNPIARFNFVGIEINARLLHY